MGGKRGRVLRAGKDWMVGRGSRAGEVLRAGRFQEARRSRWGFEQTVVGR